MSGREHVREIDIEEDCLVTEERKERDGKEEDDRIEWKKRSERSRIWERGKSVKVES